MKKVNRNPKKDLVFQTHCNIETPIISDQHKVLQIIKHLVDNAWKYTERGSVHLTITKINQVLHISIKDTGMGIELNDHDKIWKRFIQLDIGNMSVNQGNGVGLALVKYFIEILGGSIQLRSEKNIGSEFIVKLPLNQNQVDQQNGNPIFQKVKETK